MLNVLVLQMVILPISRICHAVLSGLTQDPECPSESVSSSQPNNARGKLNLERDRCGM